VRMSIDVLWLAFCSACQPSLMGQCGRRQCCQFLRCLRGDFDAHPSVAEQVRNSCNRQTRVANTLQPITLGNSFKFQRQIVLSV
jgi:hypothetical protein